ncbi:MAG TPA: hypothetical protein VN181_03830, partial [Thermoanaerobaculia bacterium]|nr:hypothetical protein [Thermoanaerobaculia bacterium]
YLALDASLRRARERVIPPPSQPTRTIDGEYEHAAYGIASVHEGVLRWGRLALSLTHYEHDTWRAVDDDEEVDELVTFADGTMTFYAQTFTARSR